MERIHTQAGATQSAVGKLSKEVLNLAKSGQVTAGPTQLADALYRIEGAGYRGAAAMKALKASAELAAVGNSDVEDTAKTLTQVLKPGIKGVKDFTDAVGQINATVGAGDLRLQPLVDALGTGVVTSAKQAGLSFKDVTGALAVFGDETNNVSGWSSQLATALHFITNPGMKASGALHDLGIGQYQLAKDFRGPNGLVTGLKDLKAHLDAVGKIRAEADLGDILPGGRGRVLSVLLNQVGLLQQKEKQIAGTTADFGKSVAQTQQTMQFKIQAAWAQLQADAVQLGSALGPLIIPAFTKIVDFITKLTDKFNSLSPATKKTIFEIAGIAAVLGPGLTIFSKVLSTFSALATVLRVVLTPALSLITLAFNALNDSALALNAKIVILNATYALQEKAIIAWTAVTTAATAAWDAIQGALTLSTAATVANTIATKASEAATLIWTGVVRGAEIAQIAWNAVMDTNPIILIGTAIALLIPVIALLIKHFGAVEAAVRSALNTVRSVTVNVFNDVAGFLKKYWQDILIGIFTGGLGLLVKYVVAHWTQIKQDTSNVWNAIKGVLNTAWSAIKSAMKAPFDAMTSIASNVWDAIKGAARTVWGGIKSALDAVWGAIRSLFRGYMGDIATIASAGWKGIKAVAGVAWGGIKTAIVNPVSDMVSKIQSAVSGMAGWLSNKWGDIKSGVAAFAGQIKSSVVSAISGALNQVIGFLNDIIGVLDKLPFVNIHKIPLIGAGGGGGKAGGTPSAGDLHKAGFYQGGMVDRPMYMVGEEAPKHPEYVLATNPAYRGRNLGLWRQAGHALGVPGFAEGGIPGYAQGGEVAVVERAGPVLLGSGFNKIGAAGVLGNAQQESSWNPAVVVGGNGGLWGFTAGNKSLAGLQAYADRRKASWTDPAIQAAYLLTSTPPSYVQAMNSQSGPAPAADWWMSHWELPAVATENAPNREAGAISAYEILTGHKIKAGSGGILGAIGSALGSVVSSIAGVPISLLKDGAKALIGKLPNPADLLPKWLQGFGGSLITDATSFLKHKAESALNSINPFSGGGGGGANQNVNPANLPSGSWSFDGVTIAKWIAPILTWARGHGWTGHVTSGYRPGFDPHTVTGYSNHSSLTYPGGAIDVGGPDDYADGHNLYEVLTHYKGSPTLKWGGIYISGYPSASGHDYGHFSATGRRKGGMLGGPEPDLMGMFASGGILASGHQHHGKLHSLPPASTSAFHPGKSSTGPVGEQGPFPFPTSDLDVLASKLMQIYALDGGSGGIGVGPDGDTTRLQNLLSFYTDLWSNDAVFPSPNFGSIDDPSQFIVVPPPDANGNQPKAYISSNINTVYGQLQQALGWESSVVSDLQSTAGFSSALAAPIQKAINRRAREIAKIQKRLRKDMARWRTLQKSLKDMERTVVVAKQKRDKAKQQLQAMKSKTDPLTSKIASDRKQIAKIQGQKKISKADRKKIGDLEKEINSSQAKINKIAPQYKATQAWFNEQDALVKSLEGDKGPSIPAVKRELKPLQQEMFMLGGSRTSIGTGGELGAIQAQLGTPANTSAVAVAEGNAGSSSGLYGLKDVVQGWVSQITGTGGALPTQQIQLGIYRRELSNLQPGAQAALAAANSTGATSSSGGAPGTTGSDVQTQILEQQLAAASERARSAEALLKSSVPLPGFAHGGIPFAGWFGTGGDITASQPTLIGIGDGPGTETASVRRHGQGGDDGIHVHNHFASGMEFLADFVTTTVEMRERGQVKQAIRRLPGAGGGSVRVSR